MADQNPNGMSPGEVERNELPSDEDLQQGAKEVMARIKLFGAFIGIFAILVIGFVGYCAYFTFGIIGLVIVAAIVGVISWLLIKVLAIF